MLNKPSRLLLYTNVPNVRAQLGNKLFQQTNYFSYKTSCEYSRKEFEFVRYRRYTVKFRLITNEAYRTSFLWTTVSPVGERKIKAEEVASHY